MQARGSSGQGEQVSPGVRGSPEVVASTLRPKGGVQVKPKGGRERGRGISLARISVHVKNC